MDSLPEILLLIPGFIAGLIDSVAGGGGLITVPSLSLVVGAGAKAIGTNKMAAVCSSLAALAVYRSQGHVRIKGNRIFAILTGMGAALGALVSPSIPPDAYKGVLLTVCPIMLLLVYNKDLWTRREIEDRETHHADGQSSGKPKFSWTWGFWLAGLACGFYDGVAGPGGGTLMFISLFVIAKMPLVASIATAKVANLSSASVSLATFAVTGNVIWTKGVWVAVGISFGAFLGAKLATKRAAPVARIALLVAASLLILKLAFS